MSESSETKVTCNCRVELNQKVKEQMVVSKIVTSEDAHTHKERDIALIKATLKHAFVACDEADCACHNLGDSAGLLPNSGIKICSNSNAAFEHIVKQNALLVNQIDKLEAMQIDFVIETLQYAFDECKHMGGDCTAILKINSAELLAAIKG